jgi:hypothetical protein
MLLLAGFSPCAAHGSDMKQCSAKFFVPTAHPTLEMSHEGTPQSFALRKGVTKQYVTKEADPICKLLSYRLLIKINELKAFIPVDLAETTVWK